MIGAEPFWAIAARAASSKKGEDVVALDVASVLVITDVFVIASAPNTRLVRSIADEIEMQIDLAGGPKPLRVEGLKDAGWVLIDYGDFVIHVFRDEVRSFYDLERLWSDAPRLAWTDYEPATAASEASR